MEATKTRRGPPRFRENRKDPRRGEGRWGLEILGRDVAELVTPNGLVWNEGHYGFVENEPTTNKYGNGDDFRPVGHRSGNRGVPRGGYNIVNGITPDCKGDGGNRSGE